ncbi:invasion associated locus B family protein [Coralliovum pocilloporae]|uniref:invasion associated locus B family protein n=1 Tax=Coralliovum pocilloporae TaxID=3066369 RepID=UPI0033073EFB
MQRLQTKILSAAFAMIVAGTAGSVPALAQSAPSLIETHKDWGVYTHTLNGKKSCFLLSQPLKLEPVGRNHGDVYFFVTYRPTEGVNGETSVKVGYSFKEGSDVAVNVDGVNFEMFTRGEGAWIRNAADEPRLLDSMKRGRTMVVRGQSSRGTQTIYTFSLSGITAAQKKVVSTCR